MAQTLEERVAELEDRLGEIEERVREKPQNPDQSTQGWRWFVGIDAENPHFDNAVRFGQEWRNADRPSDEEAEQNVPA